MEQLLERFDFLESGAALLASRLLSAAAILLVGAVAAWIVERLLGIVCNRVGLDRSIAGRRLTQLTSAVGLEATPSVVLRRFARWTILFGAAARAALALELESVAVVIDRAVLLAPTIAIVLVILYLGVALGERLSRAAEAAAERDDTVPPALAAGVVRGTILAATIVLALEAAGVTADLPVIILSICLAGAIGLVVVGLVIGARGLLENLLAARYVEENYIEGQMVTFNSQQAQIRSIGLTATIVRTSDGSDHITPNAVFLRESV